MDDFTLRDRRSEEMRIRGVRKEYPDTAFPDRFEKCVVRRRTMWKRISIELPVTRMNESTDRSLDEESDRVRDRMVDGKRSHLKAISYLDRSISMIFLETCEYRFMFTLLELDKFICHRCCIDGNVSSDLLHSIKHCSYMIDMPMGDADSDHFFPTEVCKIRDGRIDTVLILIGKLESHVDDEHFIFIFEDHRVESDLFTSSEWDDTKCSFLEWLHTVLRKSEILFQGLIRCETWK